MASGFATCTPIAAAKAKAAPPVRKTERRDIGRVRDKHLTEDTHATDLHAKREAERSARAVLAAAVVGSDEEVAEARARIRARLTEARARLARTGGARTAVPRENVAV